MNQNYKQQALCISYCLKLLDVVSFSLNCFFIIDKTVLFSILVYFNYAKSVKLLIYL